jgi:hypothetical protein
MFTVINFSESNLHAQTTNRLLAGGLTFGASGYSHRALCSLCTVSQTITWNGRFIRNFAAALRCQQNDEVRNYQQLLVTYVVALVTTTYPLLRTSTYENTFRRSVPAYARLYQVHGNRDVSVSPAFIAPWIQVPLASTPLVDMGHISF